MKFIVRIVSCEQLRRKASLGCRRDEQDWGGDEEPVKIAMNHLANNSANLGSWERITISNIMCLRIYLCHVPARQLSSGANENLDLSLLESHSFFFIFHTALCTSKLCEITFHERFR
jgi:hypothetical protein